MRDASLKAPPGMDGIVIDVRVFSRKERDEALRKREKKQVEQFRKAEKRRMKILTDKRDERLREMLKDEIASEFYDVDGSLLVKAGKKLSSRLLERIDFTSVDFTKDVVKDRELGSRTKKLGADRRGCPGGGPQVLREGDREAFARRRAAAGSGQAGQGLHRQEAETLGGRQDRRHGTATRVWWPGSFPRRTCRICPTGRRWR